MSNTSRILIDQDSSRKKELCLYEVEGSAYEVTCDGQLFRGSTDEQCATLAMETIHGLLGSRNQIDLLIGGLGFGASLTRSLDESGLRSVTVVEPEYRMLDWARRHLSLSTVLDDRRVELVEGAFEVFVRASPQSYHGILIDFDRGPANAILDSNRRAYSVTMLDLLARRLRADGILAVCTDEEDTGYRRALAEVFTEVGSRPVGNQTPGRMIHFGRS